MLVLRWLNPPGFPPPPFGQKSFIPILNIFLGLQKHLLPIQENTSQNCWCCRTLASQDRLKLKPLQNQEILKSNVNWCYLSLSQGTFLPQKYLRNTLAEGSKVRGPAGLPFVTGETTRHSWTVEQLVSTVLYHLHGKNLGKRGEFPANKTVVFYKQTLDIQIPCE